MNLQTKLIEKIREYMPMNNLHFNLNLSENFYVSFLAQGEYNLNYVVSDTSKKYVFRVNLGSQIGLDNQITYEYNALKSLEKSGVTPRVFFVDDNKNYFDSGILIMEFLEGEPLDYGKDLDEAAKIFAIIHSMDIDKDHTFKEEKELFSDRVSEAKGWLKEVLSSEFVETDVKRFFSKFLEWAEENLHSQTYFLENPWPVINNTEVNSHNFIIGPEKSYLIDWEKPVLSDPSQDLTQFLALTTTLWKRNYRLSDDEKEQFFKTYVEHSNHKNSDIRERVHLYTPYLYLRALSWCASAFVEYKNPEKEIVNMDTLNKIKEYLDIDFLKKLLKDYFD